MRCHQFIRCVPAHRRPPRAHILLASSVNAVDPKNFFQRTASRTWMSEFFGPAKQFSREWLVANFNTGISIEIFLLTPDAAGERKDQCDE
jgi:hypothetical protein